MAKEATSRTLGDHIATLKREASSAYRKAIAAQVRGTTDTAAWDVFRDALSALLLYAWCNGAYKTIRAGGGIPSLNLSGDRLTFADVALTYDGHRWQKPVADAYRERLPITRAQWEELLRRSRDEAGVQVSTEIDSGLSNIVKRSKVLQQVLRGVMKPPETPAPRDVPAGGFMVTGINREQVEQVRDLVAKVIEEKPTVSVVGKEIQRINVGDFVTTAQVRHGINLTDARLQTIYRTNLNRAMSQGTAEVLENDTVRQYIPLVEYRSAQDKRTRKTHRAFSGFVGTIDTFRTKGITPPCGYNCRCTLLPIPVGSAITRGFATKDGSLDERAINAHNGRRQSMLDSSLMPDPGWVA